MSNTYFRSKNKPTPIKAELFPSHYLCIMDIKGDEITYKCSDKDFDFVEPNDELFENAYMQMAESFTYEINRHLSLGNKDHWLFTIEDPLADKIVCDLVISQQLLASQDEEIINEAVYLLSVFVFQKLGCLSNMERLEIPQTDYLN